MLGGFRLAVSPRAVVLVCAALNALLVIDALVRDRGDFDYRVINLVREIRFPGDRDVMEGVSRLTGTEGAVLAWFLALVAFPAMRRWPFALALAVMPAGSIISSGLQQLVGRPRPDFSRIDGLEGAIRAAEDQDLASFPSGHVIGAVLLYGLLFLVAGGIDRPFLRWSLRAALVAVIVLTGISRIWLGSHWMGDVVAAYAIGAVLLAVVVLIERRASPHIDGVPFIHARTLPHDEPAPHAHALTSLILFRGDEAWKVYSPGFVPQAIYWLSFQAPFPYANNEAVLQAAIHRRNLAGTLTQYWFGERRVARALRIDEVGGRPAVVSEFIPGREPSHDHARPFLLDLANRFAAAGLPTWQIDPRQPRSFGNLIETDDGRLVVIDLESGIVSPLASPRAWVRAVRRRVVPLFDDVYFDITRDYVVSEQAAMRSAMGDDWYERLLDEIDHAEQTAIAWHASEPRVWARMVGWFMTGFGTRTIGPRVQRTAERGERKAAEWLEGSITRWESEGRITTIEARQLTESVENPEFQSVLPHFGVHLMIGVALRFPLGSIARVTYTGCNLAGATILMLTRRRSRQQWKRAVTIHSPLVLLVAGLPAVGTFSYLLSKPVRTQGKVARLALDAVGEKVPGRLYRRLGLRRLLAGASPQRRAEPAAGRQHPG